MTRIWSSFGSPSLLEADFQGISYALGAKVGILDTQVDFRQGLSSNLHFRQYELPISEPGEGFRRENAQFSLTYGKELLRVAAKKWFKSQQ